MTDTYEDDDAEKVMDKRWHNHGSTDNKLRK
jgi:hypothetical protein